MLAGAALILLLTAVDRPQAEPSAAEAELEWCAERIEALKSRQQAGRELERLLRRAEELARQLDRARAALPAAPQAPSPEELRERADAWRDEADRLAGEIAAVDVRIQDLRRVRGSEPGDPVSRAAIGGPHPDPRAAIGAPHSDLHRLHVLAAQRAELAERRARAEAEANRLEREAREIEAAERIP